MKLNNIFIALSFLLLLSCAKDEIDINRENTEELRYDATLSLSVAGDGTIVTKADDAGAKKEIISAQDSIKRLSAAVFMNDRLVAFKDSTELGEDGKEVVLKDVKKHITGLDFIKVPSGNAKVLLIANYKVSDELQKEGTALKDYENIVVGLSDEINGRLTMSSKILNVSFAQGANFMGLSATKGPQTIGEITGTELQGSTIELYRSIAEVMVDNLDIVPFDQYKGSDGNAKFILDTIYVANVKSKSYLFPNNETHEDAEYMISNSTDFWCGAFNEEIGTLKTGEATKKSFLCYDFVNFIKDWDVLDKRSYEKLYETYPFLNYPSMWGKVDKDLMMFVQGNVTNITNGLAIPVGTYYYVYGNQHEKVNNTLMIIKGRYIYTPAGKEEKIVDSYYTIAINKDGSKTDLSVDQHDYIKRNYRYCISLTIKGPGSSTPYDREKSANISSSVKVKPWNTVMQDETVE